MSALDRAILEVGGREFHMVGNVQVTQQMMIDYILEGFGSNVSAVLDQFFDGEGRRQGAYLDLGAGDSIFEFSFQGWKGAEDSDGNPVPWGGVSGADPLVQMQVFMDALRQTTTDSMNPARLQVGEYSPGGRLDSSLTVALQSPRMSHVAEEPHTFDGDLQCIECSNIAVTRDAIDSMQDDILLEDLNEYVDALVETVPGFEEFL
jgi:hypothetical protein